MLISFDLPLLPFSLSWVVTVLADLFLGFLNLRQNQMNPRMQTTDVAPVDARTTARIFFAAFLPLFSM